MVRKPLRGLLKAYLSLIVIGTILLQLPFMTQSNGISFIDALFTSTSAVCVTGLNTLNTANTFSLWGQFIILILIQLGGVGIIFYSTFLLLLGRKRFSIGQEDLLGSFVTFDSELKKKDLAKSIFKFTLQVELAGFLLLFLFINGDLAIKERIWHSLFHSVSAFCNAGFSSFPNSLENYSQNMGVNLTIMSLIIIGGLGFINFKEIQSLIKKRTFRWYKFSLLLKISLSYSIGLILAGTLLLLFFDYHSDFAELDVPHKVLVALFHSVSARTAGFNTVPIDHFTNASLFILMILMFIGGGSGSCAGGIKVSTIASIFAVFRARIVNSDSVWLFKRRLGLNTIRKSTSLFMIWLLLVMLTVLLMQTSEIGLVPHTEIKGTFLEYAFEAFSAMGTVGLSTGVTPTLTNIGKLLTITLMFIGRLGPLSLLIAWMGTPTVKPYKYPEENLPVG